MMLAQRCQFNDASPRTQQTRTYPISKSCILFAIALNLFVNSVWVSFVQFPTSCAELWVSWDQENPLACRTKWAVLFSRGLHNSLQFSFSKMFVCSCLLCLVVTHCHLASFDFSPQNLRPTMLLTLLDWGIWWPECSENVCGWFYWFSCRTGGGNLALLPKFVR